MGQGIFRSSYFYDLSTVKYTPEQRNAVEKLIKTEPMVVFSKSYCPHCVSAKQLLESHDVDTATVREINYEADGLETQAILYQITGQKTVPNIFVGGGHIGGNDHLHKLAKSGQLKEVLDRHKIPNSFPSPSQILGDGAHH
ncbi:Glutaredoxin-2, mitochondrial [Seminavis robusta]|uniref:Glutaredoxin-2, mitochondrial n=1 Tax=Seminavis robusta TaxID=568900 RepID=A0A9N8EWF3_9STRA|nr:Glutaredoxin-2, mitochondrial [Seminavis robusta]|eukprot:Sro2021_g311430.1 Glutaredoxin-2, mitochondrial (141) ;mRNA; r:7851-8273